MRLHSHNAFIIFSAMPPSLCRKPSSLTSEFGRNHQRTTCAFGLRTMGSEFPRRQRIECFSCSSDFIAHPNTKELVLDSPSCVKQLKEWAVKWVSNLSPEKAAGFGCYCQGNEVNRYK